MTSIPASRSARAMIFAPRSCPSSPGLATTTRIFFWGAEADILHGSATTQRGRRRGILGVVDRPRLPCPDRQPPAPTAPDRREATDERPPPCLRGQHGAPDAPRGRRAGQANRSLQPSPEAVE